MTGAPGGKSLPSRELAEEIEHAACRALAIVGPLLSITVIPGNRALPQPAAEGSRWN
jgi:hypothetical protein